MPAEEATAAHVQQHDELLCEADASCEDALTQRHGPLPLSLPGQEPEKTLRARREEAAARRERARRARQGTDAATGARAWGDAAPAEEHGSQLAGLINSSVDFTRLSRAARQHQAAERSSASSHAVKDASHRSREAAWVAVEGGSEEEDEEGDDGDEEGEGEEGERPGYAGRRRSSGGGRGGGEATPSVERRGDGSESDVDGGGGGSGDAGDEGGSDVDVQEDEVIDFGTGDAGAGAAERGDAAGEQAEDWTEAARGGRWANPSSPAPSAEDKSGEAAGGSEARPITAPGGSLRREQGAGAATGAEQSLSARKPRPGEGGGRGLQLPAPQYGPQGGAAPERRGAGSAQDTGREDASSPSLPRRTAEAPPLRMGAEASGAGGGGTDSPAPSSVKPAPGPAHGRGRTAATAAREEDTQSTYERVWEKTPRPLRKVRTPPLPCGSVCDALL